MMEQYFDRVINLYFYDMNNQLLGQIVTPKQGRKPDLLVKGTKIANSQIIETTVVVTNLDPAFKVNEVTWIRASIGYASMTDIDVLKLNVLWAEITKIPPDKQITFHCIEANSDLVIMNTPVMIQMDKPMISEALSKLISLYNDALQAIYPEAASELSLDSIPDMRMNDAQLVNKYIVQGESWWDACRNLEQMFVAYDSNGKVLLPLKIQAINNKLVAYLVTEPNTEELRAPSDKYVDVKYVVSASRWQVVYTVRTLFDPRIQIGDTVAIPNSSLVSKRSVGQEPELDIVKAYFRADVRIDFAFGTVDQNSMIILGNAI